MYTDKHVVYGYYLYPNIDFRDVLKSWWFSITDNEFTSYWDNYWTFFCEYDSYYVTDEDGETVSDNRYEKHFRQFSSDGDHQLVVGVGKGKAPIFNNDKLIPFFKDLEVTPKDVKKLNKQLDGLPFELGRFIRESGIEPKLFVADSDV